MEPYLDAIKEIKELADAEEIHRVDDVSIYLERFTDLDLIATGIYAEVYEMPGEPDKVVKLCNSKIDGYYLFARWCMRPENQHNPHVPTIHREDTVELSSGRIVRFYVMERLEDISDDGTEPTRPSHFHDYDFGKLWGTLRTLTLPFADPKKQFNEQIQTADEFVEQIQEPRSHFYMNADERKPVVIDDQIIDDHEALLNTLFDVLSFVDEHGVMDLHGGNYMLRGDTIVITDPISHKYANPTAS
ncbi:hypothetical protein [Shewanella halifaxensis]|uniref:hypothetical protein n=1 Tax=Shewanella halifaxensis TaxID=271098 RepID=UPI000D594409|nr:hypothetical protein [Shewanella halifaxensis]